LVIAMSNKWPEVRAEALAHLAARDAPDDDVRKHSAESAENLRTDNVVAIPSRRDRSPPVARGREPGLDTPMVSVVQFEAGLVAERALRLAAQQQTDEAFKKLAEGAATLADAVANKFAEIDAAIKRLEARGSRPTLVDDTSRAS
jgi:hypothetical protein